MTLPPLGVWVDDAPKLVREAPYWDALRLCGVSTAAMMVDTFARGFDTAYSMRDLERAALHSRDRDIGLVVTVVPEPTRDWIDDMRRQLDPVLSLGFCAIDNDAEGLWVEDAVRGFRDLDEAAVYLMASERELAEKHDVWLEVDTHTGHREASSRAMLVPLADRACYQLYTSRHDWRHREVAWGGPGGPGRFQRAKLARIRSVVPGVKDGRVKLAVGQALWDQVWPGYQVEESLNLALDAVVEPALGCDPVDEVRGWSGKWLVGARSSSIEQMQVRSWVERTWGARRPSR
ncbi:MAG: hypothetical protein WC554_11710 [Clostridia bacterium]|jgi:hypothetical protein